MRQEYPNYYRKNFVKEIQKRKPQKDPRGEIASKMEEIILLCLKEQGHGEEVRRRILLTAREEAERYEMRKNFCADTIRQLTGKKMTGQQYAKEKTMKETASIMPDYFCLPNPYPKKKREYAEYAAKKDAADMTMRLYAIACKEVLEYGKADIKNLCKEVKRHYREGQGNGSKGCRKDCGILYRDPGHDKTTKAGEGESEGR